jgi:hypothetical protein
MHWLQACASIIMLWRMVCSVVPSLSSPPSVWLVLTALALTCTQGTGMASEDY